MERDVKYYFKKVEDFPFPEIFKVDDVIKVLDEKDKLLSKFKESEIKGTMGKNVHFEGVVILEEGARVLHNSIIIGPVYVGKNTVVGPDAHIRSGTIIGNNCKIGKTEIKGSVIMNNVRADHFGYVGDSILGDSSHLGAGAVTANFRFDGKETFGRRKLGAIVGDNTQVGVNATTLPGTFIGSNSWIYPGVVVRGFVPENSILKWKPNYEIVEKK
ncbi:MAG: glucose-1-phosphate thymidylyltransferase [Nanoarchaeota archaeon]|nr:glucose-1-phosphate thymidylyltransferase [Nanoarchaeota archaeon]